MPKRTVVIAILGSDQGAVGTNQILFGTRQWHEWLVDGESFIFKGLAGHFTARHELRRGIPYWYAYRRRGGKLSKTYVGKSEDLTLERMEMVSTALAGDVNTVIE
jgi:LuxR family transcriptional regulator, maltose regulon positive regulatory protein